MVKTMTNEATEASPTHPDEAVSDNVSPESEAPALLNRDSGDAISAVDNDGDPSEENEQTVATIIEGTPESLARGQVGDSSIGGINGSEENKNDQSEESPGSEQARTTASSFLADMDAIESNNISDARNQPEMEALSTSTQNDEPPSTSESNSNHHESETKPESNDPGSPDSADSKSSMESSSSVETQTSTGSDGSIDSFELESEKMALEDDDNDITSRAAIALAAVAVAANAKHSSPSAAAQAARALAPGIMPGAGMSPRRNEDMKMVSLKAVKRFLKKKSNNTVMVQKLADGENDAFLQHLLLLEFFRVAEESEPSVPKSPSATLLEGQARIRGIEKETIADEGVFDEELAALAADRVRSILGVIGGAYDSMIGLLPSMPESETDDTDGTDSEFDGIVTPPVIPDLLPPCSSTSNDATAEFFRECACPCEIDENDEKDDAEAENEEDGEIKSSEAEGKATGSGHASASSVLSSMFSSVKRSSISSPRASLTGVFRKRNRRNRADKKGRDSLKKNDSRDDDLGEGEYSVLIEREMLGLTVENVLERTVVRTVLPGGAAKSAGAQVGSLIVKVGNVSTKNLTHFETIDELRQSQRPLRLVMRQISTDALSLAREEMGRLIRGAGYGTITGGGSYGPEEILQQSQENIDGKGTSMKRPQIETYSRVLHERWTCDDMTDPNSTELPVHKAAEKLVWILTLLIYGLEREAGATQQPIEALESPREKQLHHHHDPKDYADASKSISKVLLDFMKNNVDSRDNSEDENASSGSVPNNMIRRGRKLAPPPPPPGTKRVGSSADSNPNKPLIQIGDVLHRTYTFLADPTSPPAALLRGEVIAFLCDVLDIDTAMELCDEENASSTAGGEARPISDLGSAGSLLKLIILNCSMMRSPDCGAHESDEHEYLLNEQRRRFGYERQFSSVDAHRLHAGNRFLAVVHRLAASRSLSARVTACSLGPVLWGHLDFAHLLQVRGPTVLRARIEFKSSPLVSFLFDKVTRGHHTCFARCRRDCSKVYCNGASRDCRTCF